MRLNSFLVVCSTWLLLAGCDPQDPCPAGTEPIRGMCVEVGGGDAANVVTCEPTGTYAAFGQACSSQEDCTCPAGTCNTEQGFCTELNCERTSPDGGMLAVCPPDWSCTTIAGLPGVPAGVESICLPP